MSRDFRNKSVDAYNFAQVPSSQVPRSTFRQASTHKTTFDAGFLVPIFCQEVLPGDEFNFSQTAFARMSTPIFPLMDNLHLDTFYFFVPNRLVWDNWVKLQGEQKNPADTISYLVPIMTSPTAGYAVNSLQDYFGLPTVGVPAITVGVPHSALPLRAYNLIYNEWFRDENLQNSVVVDTDDGPDTITDYVLLRRGKRYDYFTSCLPYPQKGAASVSLPLGSTAPVRGLYTNNNVTTGIAGLQNIGTAATGTLSISDSGVGSMWAASKSAAGTAANVAFNSTNANVYADLSAATAATINQLRLAFQTQRLLERDARGGTRYTEILRSHFGVQSPDARLQRPEYLGGSSSNVETRSVPQTSAAGVTGSSTPLAQLGANAQVINRTQWSKSFVEHGYIIGIANVRADLSYQQGLDRHWSRRTRYDFYMPVFANLGEQEVLNKEIYCTGAAADNQVFGYNERWSEYRYKKSNISGLFRSTASGTLDGWHLSQKFASLPTLNSTFITDTPPMDRVLAVASQTGKHFLADFLFDNRVTRPLPLYSVPGMIDHL
jgi:hypothetical protein